MKTERRNRYNERVRENFDNDDVTNQPSKLITSNYPFDRYVLTSLKTDEILAYATKFNYLFDTYINKRIYKKQ